MTRLATFPFDGTSEVIVRERREQAVFAQLSGGSKDAGLTCLLGDRVNPRRSVIVRHRSVTTLLDS